MRKRRELELKAQKKANRRNSSGGTSPSPAAASGQPSGSISQSDTPIEGYSQSQSQSLIQTQALSQSQPQTATLVHSQAQAQMEAQIQRALQITPTPVVAPGLPGAFVISGPEAINPIATTKQQPAPLVAAVGSGSLVVPITSTSLELEGLPVASNIHAGGQTAGHSSASDQGSVATVAAAAASAAAAAVAGYVPSDPALAELLPRPPPPAGAQHAETSSAQQPVDHSSQSHSALLDAMQRNNLANAQRRWREEKRREIELKRTRGGGSKRGRKKQRVENISPVAALPLTSQALPTAITPVTSVQVSTLPGTISVHTSNVITAPKTTLSVPTASAGIPASAGTAPGPQDSVSASDGLGSRQASASLNASPAVTNSKPTRQISTIQDPRPFAHGIPLVVSQSIPSGTSKIEELPKSEMRNNVETVNVDPVAEEAPANNICDNIDDDTVTDELSRATHQAMEDLNESDNVLGVEQDGPPSPVVEDISLALGNVHQSDDEVGSINGSVDGNESEDAATLSESVIGSRAQEHVEAKLNDIDNSVDVNADGVHSDTVANIEISVVQDKAETGDAKADAAEVGQFQDGGEEIISAADPWDALDPMDNP